MNELQLDGHYLTIADVIDVVRGHKKISLGSTAIEAVNRASAMVAQSLKEQRVIYGITTGFGLFSDRLIAPCDVMKLQQNLIRSHACGVGVPYSNEIVRCMMLLRINSLIKGYSGITLTTLQALVGLLNHDVIPFIPSQGSLGASGDLAPLAHMALTMIGEGKAFFQGKLMASSEALRLVGLAPITLQAKEGLALINGTQALTSIGLLTLYDAMQCANLADVVLSFSMSALRGIIDAFDSRIAAVRPHQGQIQSASNVRFLLQSNTFVSKQNELRVQDAYSLRCASQVHGASRDAFAHVLSTIEIEINSVSDNPILFVEEDEVISGGNFHGQPLALAFDYLGIAISELANISERRLERLVNPALSNGLPAFLSSNGGLQSGFMIVQYSAASLVSENKVYAHPASVDSIPSSANQEDHVSMGNFAARKAAMILENTKRVLSMELLAALQAIDLRKIVDADRSYHLGTSLQSLYDLIRNRIAFVEEDVIVYEYFEAMEELFPTILTLIQEWRLPSCN